MITRIRSRRIRLVALVAGVALAGPITSCAASPTAPPDPMTTTPTPAPAAPLIPIPDGYPTLEVAVFATVTLPASTDCITIHTPDGSRYRLLGTPHVLARTIKLTGRPPQPLAFTGNAIPYIDRDGNRLLVPLTPACPRLPAFMASRVETIPQVLVNIARALTWPNLLGMLADGGDSTGQQPAPAPQPRPTPPAGTGGRRA